MNEERFIASLNGCFFGKKVFITGGSSGIGKEAVRLFLLAGAEVTMAVRSPNKAQGVVEEYARLGLAERLTYLQYDQSDPSTFEGLCSKLNGNIFDILVFDAGLYFPKKSVERESAITFKTNAVGTILLSEKLRGLYPNARSVYVTSIYHHKPHKGDYKAYAGRHRFSRSRAYAVSKQAVLDYATMRLENDEDVSIMHPGITRSNILRSYAPIMKRLGNGFLYLFTHKPNKAARGILYAAAVKGRYSVPRGLFHISGEPKNAPLPKNAGRYVSALSFLLDQSESR